MEEEELWKGLEHLEGGVECPEGVLKGRGRQWAGRERPEGIVATS